MHNLRIFIKIEAAGVAEQAQSYMDYLVNRADARDVKKVRRKNAMKDLKLDTPGKRLRYIREEERRESVPEMAEAIGVTPEYMLSLEEDAEKPDTRVLTALTGLLRDPVTRSNETLDWVLTGKG